MDNNVGKICLAHDTDLLAVKTEFLDPLLVEENKEIPERDFFLKEETNRRVN